jgi:hypothetical protein
MVTEIEQFELQYRTFLYSCWGWLKSKLYKRKVDKQDARILEVAASVKKRDGQLRRITRDLRTRVAHCTEADGGVFEVLLRTVIILSFLCNSLMVRGGAVG